MTPAGPSRNKIIPLALMAVALFLPTAGSARFSYYYDRGTCSGEWHAVKVCRGKCIHLTRGNGSVVARRPYVGNPLLVLKRLPGCENPDPGPMG